MELTLTEQMHADAVADARDGRWRVASINEMFEAARGSLRDRGIRGPVNFSIRTDLCHVPNEHPSTFAYNKHTRRAMGLSVHVSPCDMQGYVSERRARVIAALVKRTLQRMERSERDGTP